MAQLLISPPLGAVAGSFWADLNAGAAGLLRPVAAPLSEALKAAGAPADLRTKLVSRPLDAMLDIFDPAEDAIVRAVNRVMARKGSTQTFFGQRIDLRIGQPVDAQMDASTRNLVRSLRTISAFVVLFWTAPLELAQEMMKEGLDVASGAAAATVKLATDVTKAAGKAAQDAAKAAAGVWTSITNLFGMPEPGDGIGQGGPAEGVAAGAAVAAAGGVSLEAVLLSAVSSIVAAVTAAIPGVLNTAAGEGVKAVLGPKGSTTPAATTRDPVVIVAQRGGNIGPATPLNVNGPGVPTWALVLLGVAALGGVYAVTRR